MRLPTPLSNANATSIHRDEDRDKSCEPLKSSSSEESVRKRRPSGNISINSQLSIFSQTSLSTDTTTTTETSQTQSIRSAHNQSAHHIAQSPSSAHHHQQQQQQQQQHQLKPLKSSPAATIASHSPQSKPIKIIGNDKTVDTSVKTKYNYHDEPHSFENSMEFLEDYKNFQFEVLETTV